MDEGATTRLAFRDSLTEAVIRDLLGPAEPDELIADPPITHYLSGVLHPQADEPDEIAVDSWGLGPVGGDDEGDEDATAGANARYPSSMGLTFAVSGSADAAIQISVSAAQYVETGGEWQRVPIGPMLVSQQLGTLVPDRREPVADGLTLFTRVRPADDKGRISVTLALINTNRSADRRRRDTDAFFQPVIRVELPADGSLTFVDRTGMLNSLDDADVVAGMLLFRHVRNLAVGHGCAVAWDDSGATWLETTFTPRYDLTVSVSNPDVTGWYLDMRAPGRQSRTEVVAGFDEFISGYLRWIERNEEGVASLDLQLRAQARKHLNDCRQAVDRMSAGVAALASDTDDTPYRAFLLMCEAMVEQRVKSERVLAGRTELAPADIPTIWRPFQLAFVLLCLSGLTLEDSADRNIADLLWFPTGGGKTEAYLALIAYSQFLRRLRGRPHGVSALMRYTLRLLTAQQFERAALLMCCCESISRRRGDLGTRRFEVGLFVGRAASPLTVAEARRALDLLAANPTADTSRTGNPMQIRICVWCGSPLGVEDHKILANPDRCVVECPNPSCEFHDGLPWWVVDQDLYRERPGLVIGTVDKFASLAWRDSTGRLFNRGDGDAAGVDLIIQDELHLISGPLGTITGVYESAVDILATSERGIRPKVIASTATIRRATEQVRAVFDRDVAQFPPPAIDSRDSYFAVEPIGGDRLTRRYVGLMAPGSSPSTLLVRTYARLLYEATLGDYTADVRDTYWTLVGYFNSLRVLASAQLQVLDDVQDRMEVIGPGTPVRETNIVELTSRASAAEIAQYLRDLRIVQGADGCVDVVLATNMISVGVDVDRLGVMAVMGQPQATAEYIQATSRVGRRNAGLVFSMYNAARSRDRSHYESFLPYHSVLYRQVEATSATPFSPRARDRALHAVLVALARHTIDGLRMNPDAAQIEDHLEEVAALIDLVVQRAQHIDSAESLAVRGELDAFLGRWRQRAAGDKPLFYESHDDDNEGLLVSADKVLGGVLDGDGAPTLWSMRDVDRVSVLYEIGAS
jgi:hypothetical protein